MSEYHGGESRSPNSSVEQRTALCTDLHLAHKNKISLHGSIFVRVGDLFYKANFIFKASSAPIIRIDKVHSAGQIWFEASILFPDGRASSTYPKATFEEAEKAAYRIISYKLLIGFTPCDSYSPGSGVVESKIVEFEPEKLAECPIGMDCGILTGVKFPCPNFKTCRRAF